MLLAGLLGMTCSCNLLNGDDAQASGSIFGTWKLDKLTIEASASVVGSGSQNTSVIDFTGNSCYLNLSDKFLATAQFGWDLEMSSYSYDAEKNTIRFNKSLDVSDDGKAMVLVGTYDITELTPDKLTLRQPDVSIDIPGLFSSHQTAIYAFHRTTETIKK